jgi:hypothetical protein
MSQQGWRCFVPSPLPEQLQVHQPIRWVMGAFHGGPNSWIVTLITDRCLVGGGGGEVELYVRKLPQASFRWLQYLYCTIVKHRPKFVMTP